MNWRLAAQRLGIWVSRSGHGRASDPLTLPQHQQVPRFPGNPVESISTMHCDRQRARAWRRRVLLHKGERLHVSMVKSADEGSLAMLDAEGMVVLCYDDTGGDATYAHVLDRHVAQFYAPQSIAGVLARDNLRAAAAGVGGEQAGWRRSPSGNVFWAVTTIEPLVLRDGRVQGFAHVIRAADGPAENTGELATGIRVEYVRDEQLNAGAGQLRQATGLNVMPRSSRPHSLPG